MNLLMFHVSRDAMQIVSLAGHVYFHIFDLTEFLIR